MWGLEVRGRCFGAGRITRWLKESPGDHQVVEGATRRITRWLKESPG
jgi:hypothetical protein